ncbi:MAG TPA: hypothetical protein VLZ54_10065, partial [Arenibacter sp.]|nr:hypothetical protein [Arenibacter sp.]
MLRWIVFVIMYLALGAYSLQALRAVTRFPWVYFTYMALSLAVLGNFIFQFTWGDDPGRVLSVPKSYAFGFLLAMLTFKLITIVFLFSEDIFRFLSGVYLKIKGTPREFNFPERRRFLSALAMGIAALPFS